MFFRADKFLTPFDFQVVISVLDPGLAFGVSWRNRKTKYCCCNLSVGAAWNVQFTSNMLCTKNSPCRYVARTSNSRVIMAWKHYYYLLPQWENFHRCLSVSLIAKLYILQIFLKVKWENKQIWKSDSFSGFGCYGKSRPISVPGHLFFFLKKRCSCFDIHKHNPY